MLTKFGTITRRVKDAFSITFICIIVITPPFIITYPTCLK